MVLILSVLSKQQQVLPSIRWITSNNMISYIWFLRHISFSLYFKAHKCRKYERNRERMQRQIVPKWPEKVCMWKRWIDMISVHSPSYFKINVLSFFLVSFVWMVVLLFVLGFFFNKPVKVSERSRLKRLALIFLRIISYQSRKNSLYDDF